MISYNITAFAILISFSLIQKKYSSTQQSTLYTEENAIEYTEENAVLVEYTVN